MNVSGVNLFEAEVISLDEKSKKQSQNEIENEENTKLLDSDEFDMVNFAKDEPEAKHVTHRNEIKEPGCYYIEEANYGGEQCFYLSYMDLQGSKSTDNLFESVEQILYFLAEQGFSVTDFA